MNRTLTITIFASLLVTLVPTGAAHAHATVIEVEDGVRCYIMTDGTGGAVEFWYETNGILTGGEARGPPGPETGLPVYGVPFWDFGEIVFETLGTEPGDLLGKGFEDGSSGLQRGAGGDTQITEQLFSDLCS